MLHECRQSSDYLAQSLLHFQEYYEEEESLAEDGPDHPDRGGQDSTPTGQVSTLDLASGSSDVVHRYSGSQVPPALITTVGGGQSMQELLTAGGWSPSDVIVSIYYVGVDFEYRRCEAIIKLY